MKHNLILIRTLRADNTASPPAEVIAKLCEAVLTVPGLRVKSVEVVDMESSETVVRRIREVKARRKGEALQVAAKPHVYAWNPQTNACEKCGRSKVDKIHITESVRADDDSGPYADRR